MGTGDQLISTPHILTYVKESSDHVTEVET